MVFQMRVLLWLAIRDAELCRDENSLGAVWTVTCGILEGLEKGLRAAKFRFIENYRID